MVLINETKYACQSCIKGHRSSACTHTDRPLFEIKKKGRPATQCSHCRELRKTKQVHVKCMCEAPGGGGGAASSSSSSSIPGPSVPAPEIDSAVSFSGGESSSSAAPASTVETRPKVTKKKKKDVTLNRPTFPNGLKDFHEMTHAAEALSGLLTGAPSTGIKNEKTSVDSLLNPCMCRIGGRCDCCTDKRSSSASKADAGPSSAPSGSAGGGCCSSQPQPAPSPPLPPARSTSSYSSHNNSIDSLSDTVHSSATVKTTLPVSLRNFKPPPTGASSGPGSGSHTPSELIHHHPAHTSRHVHKTQLYNPYRSGSNSHVPLANGQPQRSASVGSRRPSAAHVPTPTKTLAEMMATFVRVQEETLARAAESGVEPADGPVVLPSFELFLRGGRDGEGAMMSGCMCGDGCACPNCVQHGNMEVDEEGAPVSGGAHKDCPPSCSSCFNCTAGFALPPAVSNIQDLIAACASELPPPPAARQNASALDATNVSVLPSSAWASRGSKEAFGIVEVPMLDCSNPKCGCPKGKCTCMNGCCGAESGGCMCGVDTPRAEPDRLPADWPLVSPETIKTEQDDPTVSSCCSGKKPAPEPALAPVAGPSTSSEEPSAAGPAPTLVRAPSKASAPAAHKPTIHKPAKADHRRQIGSHDEMPSVKNLSRSNSAASKHRPHLHKQISTSDAQQSSPTNTLSPTEMFGSSFRRDRSGSSASRSSLGPSPARSGAATPSSQVPSPYFPLDSNFARGSVGDESFFGHQQQASTSSAGSSNQYQQQSFDGGFGRGLDLSINLDLDMQLLPQPKANMNPALNGNPAANDPVDPPESFGGFRTYEEYYAASQLHEHTLRQEAERLREERERMHQERQRALQQRQEQQQRAQREQEERDQAQASALEMFILDAEMEAQLQALLGTGPSADSTTNHSGDTGISTSSTATDFSFGAVGVAQSSSSAQSSHPPSRAEYSDTDTGLLHNPPSTQGPAFTQSFDFDPPPSDRRREREFSPMQYEHSAGGGPPLGMDMLGDFGGGGRGQAFDAGRDDGDELGRSPSNANFPANAADFLLNFTAPTPAAQDQDEADDEQPRGDGGEKAQGGESVQSPDLFGGVEFDPVTFLEEALGNQDRLGLGLGENDASGGSSRGRQGDGEGQNGFNPFGSSAEGSDKRVGEDDFDFLGTFTHDSPSGWRAFEDGVRSP